MIFLGIDYGKKNIGLSIASGPLAEPLKNYKYTPKIFKRLHQICERLEVEKVVIGMPEGKMAKDTEKFAIKLSKHIQVPIVFQDETLSSKLAAQKLKQALAKKSKRHGPDHAFAATLILQEYLDFNQDENLADENDIWE